MDAKVIKEFAGREEGMKLFRVGDVFAGTEQRVEDLAKRGFVEKQKAAAKRRTRTPKAEAE